jgi:hypothetical protein
MMVWRHSECEQYLDPLAPLVATVPPEGCALWQLQRIDVLLREARLLQLVGVLGLDDLILPSDHDPADASRV